MHISDLIITKPGGLTTSESLACGLPMAVFKAFPGQEAQNADFLTEKQGAIVLEKGEKGAQQIKELLSDPQKLKLMKENCRRFHVDNVDILCGLAPEACETLPAPTHVFIGGSSGNMKEILDCILRKNPQARIVATAISLESIAELTSCMKEFDTAEVVQLSATRSRKAGPYHLMSAQNPIHIFTFQKGELR